jgi:16S rRNA (uracil1498-N3)-methyltransferase
MQIYNGVIELTEQEARHASKVMRAREGDLLTVVDGRGGWYEGIIRRITKKTIQVEIQKSRRIPPSDPTLILGMGIIKKRDRLEFAVEKAVELGVSEIMLFRSEHTIKENVRMDRLESIAISAMKQSLRAWLPQISMYHSLEGLIQRTDDAQLLMAHEKVEPAKNNISLKQLDEDRLLLLVGPEGGFSEDEVAFAKSQGAQLVSLGSYRLRAETAAVAFLSQFL